MVLILLTLLYYRVHHFILLVMQSVVPTMPSTYKPKIFSNQVGFWGNRMSKWAGGLKPPQPLLL